MKKADRPTEENYCPSCDKRNVEVNKYGRHVRCNTLVWTLSQYVAVHPEPLERDLPATVDQVRGMIQDAALEGISESDIKSMIAAAIKGKVDRSELAIDGSGAFCPSDQRPASLRPGAEGGNPVRGDRLMRAEDMLEELGDLLYGEADHTDADLCGRLVYLLANRDTLAAQVERLEKENEELRKKIDMAG